MTSRRFAWVRRQYKRAGGRANRRRLQSSRCRSCSPSSAWCSCTTSCGGAADRMLRARAAAAVRWRVPLGLFMGVNVLCVLWPRRRPPVHRRRRRLDPGVGAHRDVRLAPAGPAGDADRLAAVGRRPRRRRTATQNHPPDRCDLARPRVPVRADLVAPSVHWRRRRRGAANGDGDRDGRRDRAIAPVPRAAGLRSTCRNCRATSTE